MGDVVVKLPVQSPEEALLFGSFLNAFIESRGPDAEEFSADSDAPFLMVRTDPQPHLEMKVLIFQERSAAQAFSSGWAAARMRLPPARVS